MRYFCLMSLNFPVMILVAHTVLEVKAATLNEQVGDEAMLSDKV